MPVAAIYDIHGNLPALEAVLDEIRQADVDRVIVGGDVLPGPMPSETLTRLLDLDVPVEFIHGNGESAVLAMIGGRDPGIPEQFLDVVHWSGQQLSSEHERLVASWPPTCRIDIPGVGQVLCCHATPRNDTEVFSRVTSEDRLLPVFEGRDVSMVICGHTHMQFDRMVGPIRVVNAGSVGMPFGTPGADWLLLGPNVQLRHTSYDLAKAAACIRATSYPQAEDFAARSVLQPPSEASMLELYARVELKS